LRSLAQTVHKQGQVDLACETYQRCPLDAVTMELLYNLGMDVERRAQLAKASAVYAYIATRDPNYRELKARRARVREAPLTREPATASTPPPSMTSSTPQPPIKREPPRPLHARPQSIQINDHEDTVPDLPIPASAKPKRTLGRYE